MGQKEKKYTERYQSAFFVEKSKVEKKGNDKRWTLYRFQFYIVQDIWIGYDGYIKIENKGT